MNVTKGILKRIEETPKGVKELYTRNFTERNDENAKFNRTEKKKEKEEKKIQEEMRKKWDKEEKKDEAAKKKEQESKAKKEKKEKKNLDKITGSHGSKEDQTNQNPNTKSGGGIGMVGKLINMDNLNMMTSGLGNMMRLNKKSKKPSKELNSDGSAESPVNMLRLTKDSDTADANETNDGDLKDEDDELDDTFHLTLIEAEELEPAVKAVFEAEKDTDVVKSLHKYIIRKENEIEQICNWNYQEFITSVDELLEVRVETQKLQNSLLSLNKEFQLAGRDAIEKYKLLLQHKRMRQHITIAMEAIKQSQTVLELVATMNKYLMQREFYLALKVLLLFCGG
eukprot:TRINITY_DN4653_c0_g2_i1.p1 TRINITY_DN4653_c0_g2~~TRINITY_DN4653_c0_g2_i1.p1  ORF type:complete len:339 (-),score=125.14 TRINITY_DN4653_c0_g2_i1:78-1094(-)